MVVPGHGTHEKRACIPKGVNHTINTPVMHETGVTDWSPTNQYIPTRQIVDHHFAGTEDSYWISLCLPFKGNTNYQFFIA
jgi:uncharacterized protein (DUF427 family)